MRNLAWPAAAHVTDWTLYVEGHTRGTAREAGAGVWGRGSGAHFMGQISLAPMTHADAFSVRAFIHRLRGRAGSFYLPIPGTEFLAEGSGTLAAGVAAGASTATLTGLINSAELVAGAYAVVGDLTTTGQLVQIVSVSGSDIVFRPRLRAAHLTGVAVAFGKVSGLFRLADSVPAVAITAAGSPGLYFAIEEFR